MKALVLDHEDSFVFNLVHQLEALAVTCEVRRSTAAPTLIEDAGARGLDAFDLVVLSPGPGHPSAAAGFRTLLATRPRLPVLGVCLGMQAMAEVLGGRVDRGSEVVHGRADAIRHAGDAVFAGLASGFPAARYHSLVVTEMPHELRPIAWLAGDGDAAPPMALRHRELPWLGLQFHPESALTPGGDRLVNNFLESIR